jgi:hypothetical protein
MSDFTGVHRRWEVRITLRLIGDLEDAPWADAIPAFKRVEEALKKIPEIEFVNVCGVKGVQHRGITAVVTFAEPSTPGAAINRALELFVQACAETGVATDAIVEIVAEPGGVDPRTLL